jgi:predicted MPP superfamily phosphohydrolase
MHSGPFMEYEQMCVYTNVINDLYPDIILIPGDLTNTLASEIFPFIDAFKNLKSKYGVYVTLGNHDYFSDPNFIANKIGTLTPFNMMRNESQILKINGKELLILGIEDTRSSGAKFSEAILNYLEQTVSQAKKSVLESKLDYNELPKIMMYHKPYLFPEMLDKNIDLILSGHTHGGQIVLANFGKLNISIAAMVSPYISGLYKEKNSQMYISDGIGTVALPIRLNCPPEITVLTLV